MKPPFVVYAMEPTRSISNSQRVVFPAKDFTCIIDGIIVCNISKGQNKAEISFIVERNGNEYCSVVKNMSLGKNESIDIMSTRHLIVEKDDVIYAYSSSSSDFFDVFVSYRVLLEL